MLGGGGNSAKGGGIPGFPPLYQTLQRSRILLAILDGTIATGFKGLGTNYCIWCGTGPTVSALGVAPDGLEDKAADARRSRPEWPAGSAANTGTDCGSGPK